MGREDRRPSEDVCEWASKEYDRMQQDAPSLGGSVIDAFRDVFKGTKNIPDIAETKFEIKIYGRDDKEIIP